MKLNSLFKKNQSAKNAATLDYSERLKILDILGEPLVKEVRDGALNYAMNIAQYKTVNPVSREYYKALSDLSEEQKEAACDLLSETITDVIYRFMHLFEENPEKFKMLIKKDGVEYDVVEISEDTGSEITFDDEEGWIQRFSQIGRFV